MKTLVIAEKPSVAKDITAALTPLAGPFDKHDDYFESETYVITSAVGHLVEIAAPEEFDVKRGKWSFANLPVLPPRFDLRPIEKTKSRLNAVVKLAKRKDVGYLINACDAGREGELIFRLIEQFASDKKPLNKPSQRLWLQSMTPQAIRDGFSNLRSDAQMLPLADAARCRSEADWLVGINGTRAMTAFNSRDGGFFLTTVGRVQTPTLSVVVEREEAIRKFISRPYWEIHANFDVSGGTYVGRWFDEKFKKPTAVDGEAKDAELKPERIWDAATADRIAAAVRNQAATITESSSPSSKSSPALFDLTSLQREANGKFGYSAKTTLQIAQSLYERHKALTYPRTDSRALPEDYVPTVQDTFKMLADSGMSHLAPHAKLAIKNSYVRKLPRVFDNKKVSDHFAIIPTLQAPSGLSEAEQKVYDLVVRRFMAVFFPPAEFLTTTRISRVADQAFKTEGKVLVNPGWMAIYGKDAQDDEKDGEVLVAVKPEEKAHVAEALVKDLKTRPPARYSEATLLSAMEGAGKSVEDDEFREAMKEKGLGTPATRSSIIEGLIAEKYMLREGRELIPTAKAFQLMTLLRGLGVDELSRAELTGEWEHKLSQMEQGLMSRASFMAEITSMTERMVRKAKEYDGDTIPGDYATLQTPCPNCGGVVKENYRRYTCTGSASGAEGCGFSMTKTPAGRAFELTEVESFLSNKQIGPLEGFRSKAGWPFTAELALKWSHDDKNWKLEFDFGNDANADTGELIDFTGQTALGQCPSCRSAVFDHGSVYACEKAVPTAAQPTPSCKFKTGKIVLQQPVDTEQIQKLLTTGKTDLLDKFVSMRTRRPFKAFLAWNPEEDKVAFEFEPRVSKFPPRKTAAPAKTAAKKRSPRKPPQRGRLPKKPRPKKPPPRKRQPKRQPADPTFLPIDSLEGRVHMKLYFAPGACSFVPHVSLALAGVPFELQMLKLHKGEQSSPEFLAINPRGQLPVLVDGVLVLDQVVAITVYLDERFPEAGILPKAQPARARALSTLAWMNGAMHATFAHVFMTHKFASDAEAKAHVKAHNVKVYDAQLQTLDAMCPSVGSDAWLMGDAPCALDAYATTLLRWSGLAGLTLQSYPRLFALASRLLALPQLAQVVAAERYQLEPAPKPAA